MQDFYLGGYMLLLPTERIKTMSKVHFPKYFISASECLSDILVTNKNINLTPLHAPNDFFDCEYYYVDYYQGITKLDKKSISNLNNDITKIYEEGKYGFDSIFSDKNIAIYIYNKHFTHLKDVKLISVGLNEEEYQLFCEEENVKPCNGFYGLITSFVNKTKIADGKLLGYEVLGYHRCLFHTMACSGAEVDVNKKYGYTLNEYGLFSNYNESDNASIYICEEELGELALWQPWAIFEHEL